MLRKSSIFFFSLLAFAFQMQAQNQNHSSTDERVRESSIPDENKTDFPASYGSPMSKLSMADVDECDNNKYRTLESWTEGKSDNKTKLSAQISSDACKLVVLFSPNSSWAASLKTGKLQLDGEAFATILSKYHLALRKYYGASNSLDGIVLNVRSKTVNVEEAAREVSKIEGVSVVHVKYSKR